LDRGSKDWINVMTYPTRNETTVRELIRQELPDLVRKDGEIHNLVVEVG